MEFFKEARLGLIFLKFVKDPTQTGLIFKMSDLGRSLKRNQKMIAALEHDLGKHGSFHRDWKQKWLPELPAMESLAIMPEGSLGRAYYEHLTKNNLKINFFPAVQAERFVDYISYRLYGSHDLWHILLGYDVSPKGESEIQAFTLAQVKSPTSVMLITAGFLNLLRRQPESTPEIFSACVDAYNRGRNAKFLLDFRLEEMLLEPITKIKDLTQI